jgi:WG containing repeat/S-layer homology domain
MSVLRFWIAGCMVLGWTQISVAQPLRDAPPVRDLERHWAKDCITRLADRKQMKGYPDGSFRPEQRLTRAEYAVLMLNAYPGAITFDRPIPNFRDLPQQHWAYQAMRKAYQKKIFTGYPDNTLRPDQPISRTEALVILFNLASPNAEAPGGRYYYNLPEFPLPSEPGMILKEQFADAQQIPAWAVKPLSGVAAAFWAVDYPQGQRLRPQEAATRADAAAFLCQAAGWDGLVPVEVVVGSSKFAQLPALTQLMRAQTQGQLAWFDRQRQVTVVPALPDRKLLAVGPLAEGLVSANFETTDPQQAYGFLDRQGRLAIAPQFSQVGTFSEGLAAVHQGESWGFIDPTGKLVIAPQFDEAQPFQEGLAAVRQGDWGFVDRTGQLVVPWQPYQVSSFSQGLARVATPPDAMTYRVSYGFIDRQGKLVIPLDYSSAEPFSSGVAAVSRYDSETWTRQEGYLDTTGAWTLLDAVGSGSPAPFMEGVAVRWSGTQFGYIDPTGKWAITPQQLATNSFGPIQSVGSFQSGFAVVTIRDRYGLIDRQGKVVVPPLYSQIQEVGEGYAYANYGGTWVGYIAGYDHSANPVWEQVFMGGKWGYVKLPSGGGK